MSRLLLLLIVLSIGMPLWRCTEHEGEVTSPPLSRHPEATGRLTLAAPTESFGEILVNGARPTSISGYSIRYVPKAGFAPYVRGADSNKIVSLGTGTIQGRIECISPGTASCGRFPFFDGFHITESEVPDIWNGVWTAILSVNGIDSCSRDFAFSHVNFSSTNDNFLDTHASDITITMNISSNGTCLGTSIRAVDNPNGLPIPGTRLNAGFPTGVIDRFVGDTVIFSANPSGGLGSYKFAWKAVSAQETGDTVNFSGSTFTPDRSDTLVFAQPGTYYVRVLVRDGSDSPSQGGHYALGGVCIVRVQARPQLAAQAVSHSLPSVVTQYVWYATSLTMKNVGQETWTGTPFALSQIPSQYWSPSSAGLGGATVRTHQSHAFFFNFGMMDTRTGWQNSYWKVSKQGALFDVSNGWQIFVKPGSPGPGPGAHSPLGDFDFFAFLRPQDAYAAQSDDVVQRVRIERVELPTQLIQETGQYSLRYEAALDEVWDVNFEFYIEYDPLIFDIGRLSGGPQGNSHRITVESPVPGRLYVRGVRTGAEGLAGHGLIFDLPLKLRSAAAVPLLLPVIEVKAFR
jgi:hypothetical protein